MLTLRGLTFDAAAPRIIVPLFARSLDALRPLAAAADADPAAEVVELRLDPLPEVDFSAALALVRSLTDKPLIVTIRTKAEGGELALMPDTYAAHCRALLAQGGVDALDIEWKACGPHRDALRSAARAAGAAALYSEHHFDGTPATDAMAGGYGRRRGRHCQAGRDAPHRRRRCPPAGSHSPRPRVPPGRAAHHDEHGRDRGRHTVLRRGLWQRRHLRRDLWYHRQRPRPALGGGFERKTICLRPMICRGGLYAARNFPANGCPPYTRGLYTKQKARSLFA